MGGGNAVLGSWAHWCQTARPPSLGASAQPEVIRPRCWEAQGPSVPSPHPGWAPVLRVPQPVRCCSQQRRPGGTGRAATAGPPAPAAHRHHPQAPGSSQRLHDCAPAPAGHTSQILQLVWPPLGAACAPAWEASSGEEQLQDPRHASAVCLLRASCRASDAG